MDFGISEDEGSTASLCNLLQGSITLKAEKFSLWDVGIVPTDSCPGTAEMTLGSSSLVPNQVSVHMGKTHPEPFVLQAAQSLSQLFSLHLHGSSLDLSYLTKDNPPPQKEG